MLKRIVILNCYDSVFLVPIETNSLKRLSLYLETSNPCESKIPTRYLAVMILSGRNMQLQLQNIYG